MQDTTRIAFDSSLPAIAARLKRFREVFDLSQADVCRRTRIKPSAWSNYEQAFRRIPIGNAIELRLQFGLSLEWIYLGETSALSQSLAASLFAPPGSKPKRKPPKR